MSGTAWTLAVLAGTVLAADRLARTSFGRRLGAALIAIIVAAVLANVGVIPSASNAPPLYEAIFGVVAPIALFLMMLDVRLDRLRAAGKPMLIAFGAGTVGILAGVTLALAVTDAREVFGERLAPLAGMFAATYTGGGANFNAVALHYGMQKEGVLFAGALAIDNIMTTAWIAVTLAMPAMLGRWLGGARAVAAPTPAEATTAEESPGPFTLTALAAPLALGLAAWWLTEVSADWLSGRGLNVPSILVITTLGLVLAQLPWARHLAGARPLGLYAIYLFLAVVGAHAELAALGQLGRIGVSMIAFVTVVLLVHGLVIVGAGRVLRYDVQLVAIASTANVGGATTAMALAESFRRHDLLLPGILAGSLGNALGTYLGFLVVGLLD
jgi:uncharacterized membrane protein